MFVNICNRIYSYFSIASNSSLLVDIECNESSESNVDALIAESGFFLRSEMRSVRNTTYSCSYLYEIYKSSKEFSSCKEISLYSFCINDNNSSYCKRCPSDNPLNECSGHGTCTAIEEKEIVINENENENDIEKSVIRIIDVECKCKDGWRNEKCNNCDVGYWGKDCMECPGLTLYPRTVCSLHGVCDGSGTRNGNGNCHCNEKYQGSKCDHCITFHFGNDCTSCPGMIQVNATSVAPCYNHGNCEDDSTGKGVCLVCDVGFDPETNCQHCITTFYYDNKTNTCNPCEGIALVNRTWVSCYGNGLCDMYNDGKCICNDGFDTKTDCKDCLPGRYSSQCLRCPGLIENETISCDGHGICNEEGECECYTGWVSLNNTKSCNTCGELYYGPECKECRNIIVKDNVMLPCNGNGICNGSGSVEGNGVCICYDGFRGDGCESCNYGYFGPSCQKCMDCNGHGNCDGSGTYGGTGKCKCSIFYSGQNCSIPLHFISIAVISFFVILFIIYNQIRRISLKRKMKRQEELTKEIFTIGHSYDNSNGSSNGNKNSNTNSNSICNSKSKNNDKSNINASLLEEEDENLLDDIIINPVQSDQWIIPPDTIEIGNLIAIGSTARVYSGKYMGNVNVAVKELYLTMNKSNIIDDIRSEVTILSRVNHPNIIRFYGVCRYYNSLYFITEECRSSLSDFLYNSKEKYDSNLYKKFVIQIVTGCSFLHSMKIIHRDLKPGNILLDEYKDIKICDFGISKKLSDTLMTGMIGTPSYMAPELMVNTTNYYDQSIDIFSFGMILWEMFHQKIPYANMNPFQISLRYSQGERPKIEADCPKNLEKLIKECWNQNAHQRPSFDEILERMNKEDLFDGVYMENLRRTYQRM